MRWLVIAYHASLAALLLSAAGMVISVWVRRGRRGLKDKASTEPGATASPADSTDTTDQEPES
jgi:hypothetical protein